MTDEKYREEVEANTIYQMIRSHYFISVSKMDDVQITEQEFNDVFFKFWMFQRKDADDFMLPGMSTDETEAYENYMANYRNDQKYAEYLNSLLEPYYTWTNNG